MARSDGLLTERVGAELVVYDSDGRQAHCLSPLAACVFAHSDGRASVGDLAAIAGRELDEPIGIDEIREAVSQLQSKGLLVVPEAGAMSRREVIRKGALVGAAVATTSLIATVETASAQVAGNCQDQDCTFPQGQRFCKSLSDSQCPSCKCRRVTGTFPPQRRCRCAS